MADFDDPNRVLIHFHNPRTWSPLFWRVHTASAPIQTRHPLFCFGFGIRLRGWARICAESENSAGKAVEKALSATWRHRDA